MKVEARLFGKRKRTSGRGRPPPPPPPPGRAPQKYIVYIYQNGQQSEFQDSQGYTEKPCVEKNKNKNKKDVVMKLDDFVMHI